jgi:hypothetical protein
LVGVLSSYAVCSYVLYMRWYGLMCTILNYVLWVLSFHVLRPAPKARIQGTAPAPRIYSYDDWRAEGRQRNTVSSTQVGTNPRCSSSEALGLWVLWVLWFQRQFEYL